jgi:hypothetical protein
MTYTLFRQPSELLAAPSRNAIEQGRRALDNEIRQTAQAAIALFVAGAAGVLMLACADLAPRLTLAFQELIAFSAFCVGVMMMYQRAELKIRRFDFADVDMGTRGELRALLSGLPEGAAYLAAVLAENRTFVAAELDAIRARSAALAESTSIARARIRKMPSRAAANDAVLPDSLGYAA